MGNTAGSYDTSVALAAGDSVSESEGQYLALRSLDSLCRHQDDIAELDVVLEGLLVACLIVYCCVRPCRFSAAVTRPG